MQQAIAARSSMGVTIGDRHYQTPAEVPASATVRGPGLSLDIEAIDAQIAHWQEKRKRATNTVERCVSDGALHGFCMVRILHGLSLFPQDPQ